MVINFLYYYGTIADVIRQWEDMGIFYYGLPFLLIFAIVFAILGKTKLIGEDEKGINAVISLAVALLSLQFSYVPEFFSTIFPRTGIGLAILLIAIILMGLFIDLDRAGPAQIFFVVGGVIAVVVILSSFQSYEWWYSGWWREHMATIIVAIIFAILIAFVIGTSGKKDPSKVLGFFDYPEMKRK